MTMSIRSILAATDLSAASEEVVRAAAALAATTGAELHMVHVVETWTPGGESVLDMQRRIHEARAAFRAQVDSAVAAPVGVTTGRLAEGRPGAAILQRAGEVRADLIVIGPHRTRPFGDQVLGTTADRLVRESSLPCLVVRGPLRVPVRRAVFPSDLSGSAQATLASALRWVSALQGPPRPGAPPLVSVVHVDSVTSAERTDMGRRYELWTALDQAVEQALDLVGPGRPIRVDREILHGESPSEEILRYARESAPDILVMGTRGERPLKKALLGSVSAALALAAETPLLLIPRPLWFRDADPGSLDVSVARVDPSPMNHDTAAPAAEARCRM